MVLIGLAWIPVIQGAKGLYDYLQGVQGYLGPPIFAVFFLGVFMKRLNGPGALAALLVGFAMGMFRLARRHAGQPRAAPATSRATRPARSSGSSTTSTSSTTAC